MDNRELMNRLAAPFAPEEVKWRVSKIDNGKGLAVPYVDSRAVMDRLDEVVGPFCWRTRYLAWHHYTPKPTKREQNNGEEVREVDSQLCELSIYFAERNEWIPKVDGAENTDIETVKGGISDSFKRAAVLWGVGRYLYSIGGAWVPLDRYRQITEQGMQTLRQHYANQMRRLGLAHAPEKTPAARYEIAGVQEVPLQNGGKAVWLKLNLPDGRQQVVLYRGAKQGLTTGMALCGLKTQKQQSANGTYYEMTDFQFAA